MFNFSNAYNIALNKLDKYKDRTVFIKKDVSESVEYISEALDFVWVDVSGDYDTVYKALTDYYDILREGGVLGGKRFNSNWFDVCLAVTSFVIEHDLDFMGCNSGDWWVVKPSEQ